MSTNFNDCSLEQDSSNVVFGYPNTDKKLSESDIDKFIESNNNDNNFTGGISEIINLILAAFSTINIPLPQLPPPLLFIGAQLRPGLSTSDIAARIISRQSEAGLQVGNVFGDGPNTAEAMELIRIEEIVSALQTEAKIDVCIPPGIGITAIGVGPTGPIISQGATTVISNASGILS
jgi:hypothetical protein